MRRTVSNSRPDWVSGEMYPFGSRYFAMAPDHLMHYIDEGEGEPIIFIHGNPTWSFVFRRQILELRSEFRCIAADHIGFGLSSRSVRGEDHIPESHAHRLSSLLNHLDLRDITLFITDWGGPIGLDFARKQPERIKRLVIANTWCWPVGSDFHFKSFSYLMSSQLGQYLIRNHNMFVNRLMPMAAGNRNALTPEVMAHYRNAFPSPTERAAAAALPGQIVAANNWLGRIWEERETYTGKPALLLWGLKDIAFRRKELECWKSVLADFELHEFADCGHYLTEEAAGPVVSALRAFMERTCRQ